MGAINARAVARAAPLTLGGTARAYLSLTKPRIIGELLITTVPAMILAAQGWPSTWLVIATVIGGTLAAGGANAINCYLDRDIDQIMHRTQGRPLPLGQIEPMSALAFGVGLQVAAFVLLAATSNVLAASLALAAAAFYVFIYTMWLKRTSKQNIVIGGAAGAFPPLVGWAAVTGDLSVAAMLLFAIIFFWTPPHFWALSIRYREDYARARVPMLPVVATLEETKTQIVAYALVLVPLSLLLPLTDAVSWIYLASASVLGAMFIWYTWQLRWSDGPAGAMGVFKFSLYYLALIFIAAAVDVLILG